jgi:hypothetical protein
MLDVCGVNSMWREKASLLFPELSEELQDAAYSIYQLFFDLLPLFRDSVATTNSQRVHNIMEFAAFAFRDGDRDVENAAAVAFYEHLFDDSSSMVAVEALVDKTIVLTVWPLWAARLDRKVWFYLKERLEKRHNIQLGQGIEPPSRGTFDGGNGI